MAKIKKIPVSAFQKAVKNNCADVVVEKWNDLDVVITPVISLQSVFEIVAEVCTNSFSEDGQYIPEAVEAVLNCAVIERYTNIALPADLEERYNLVLKSGILDVVIPQISQTQYEQIVSAIENKVDYVCNSNISEINRIAGRVMDSISQLKDKVEPFFEGFNPEELYKAIPGIIAGDSPEMSAVKEYVEAQQ